MKNRYLILIASIFVYVLTSCNERETPVFGTEHEVFFEKFFMDAIYPGTEKADSTMATFFFEPNDTKYIMADLVVHLSGRVLESNINFKLRALESESTLLPNEYKLDEQYTFRALPLTSDAVAITDTIRIKMMRTPRLKDFPKGLSLMVEIVPTDGLGSGQFERSRAKIILTENSVRPLWWTKEVEVWLLGKFSDKKYRLFLDNVPGAYDLNYYMIKTEPDKAIKLTRKFKEWLSKQSPAVTEEDGTIMSVNV